MSNQEKNLYSITIFEVYSGTVLVLAKSKEEALEKASHYIVENELKVEYSYTLDQDEWCVELCPYEDLKELENDTNNAGYLIY